MMQAHWERRKSGEGGFTLVELLVVIAILGILVAIVAFAVTGLTDNAEDTACDANVKQVRTAVEAFNAESGDYPLDVAALTGSGFWPDGTPFPAEDVDYDGGPDVGSLCAA